MLSVLLFSHNIPSHPIQQEQSKITNIQSDLLPYSTLVKDYSNGHFQSSNAAYVSKPPSNSFAMSNLNGFLVSQDSSPKTVGTMPYKSDISFLMLTV